MALLTAVTWSLASVGCVPASTSPLPGIPHEASEPTTIATIRRLGDAAAAHWRLPVVTSGIVTAALPDGYFLQQPDDVDPAADARGVFVYLGVERPDAASAGSAVLRPQAGDSVEVTAVAVHDGPPWAGAAGATTELRQVSAWRLLGRGLAVAPVALSLPRAPGEVRRQFEGRLVEIATPLQVGDVSALPWRGQITVVSGGPVSAPTHAALPGAAAQAVAAENAARTVSVEVGGATASAWLLRRGDRLGRITGVVTGRGAQPGGYRVRLAALWSVVATAPRPAAPPDVGGALSVAAYNLDNAFTTFADGGTADGRSRQGCWLHATYARSHCRGAANAQEFARQRTKLLAVLTALHAGAYALSEVQNDGMTTVQSLVDGLNAALLPPSVANEGADLHAAAGDAARDAAPRYAAAGYAAVPLAPPGNGGDAIQVAIVYDATRLTPVGPPLRDMDPAHPRPPLAQTFRTSAGDVFTLIAAHLKSKLCGTPAPTDDDADRGDGQGCWNRRRIDEARALVAFIAHVQAVSGSGDVLLAGDLNADTQEDPLRLLATAGMTDLTAVHDPGGYSYVHDGAASQLDHALATPALARRITGAAAWHIDADEPPWVDYHLHRRNVPGAAPQPDRYVPTALRASDHDPVLVGLWPGVTSPP